MWLELFFVTLLGLCFGSFNTLLAYRLPRGKAVGMTRSVCPVCHHTLEMRDLIPVVSWVSTSGRCRHCHTSIHWRYPATELITAMVCVSVYLVHGLSVQTLLIALLGSHIVALCLIDLEYRIIPDLLQWVMGALGLLYALSGFIHIADALAGACIGGAVGMVLRTGYQWVKGRPGLGMGDVKFMIVAGMWLGITPLMPFFFYAGILGVISALLWRLISRDPYFPFGPALALSLFILVLFPRADAGFYALPRLIVGSVL